ncbi:neutral zinc metallopeptidase [Nocardia sp. NBC_00565]|uniref:neutral zinc metallopeptidase n=1 Tax=Nocardia sp. NBC_00565 TaxID=2975993 RepID=UPI002E810E23|nr:neutral zinc metallopeptidase [Nocardia sp. NBC_00565]WUC04506.1 neutral zinc metallopeptidase [Nocardia sp. NBC_00565]
MNSTFSSRLGPLRDRRMMLIWLVLGVVGALTATGLFMVTGQSADAGEIPTARTISDSMTPGFTGALPESANPVGDGAPPVAVAPLAGASPAGMPVASNRPVQALADHPLFAQHVGLGRVDCKLPAWRDDPEAARAFYRAAIACLDASWEPALRGAGLPFRPPRLLAPAESRDVASQCVQRLRNGPTTFYCALDETLVLPFDAVRPLVGGSRRGAQLAVLTTEYGHHVQALIGVMRAYSEKRTTLGKDTAAGQEQSRRMELQARCFSGMFLGTNFGRGDIDQQTWTEATHAVRDGDVREELLQGTEENIWGWWRWGSDKGDTWECNTWFSAAAHVE